MSHREPADTGLTVTVDAPDGDDLATYIERARLHNYLGRLDGG